VRGEGQSDEIGESWRRSEVRRDVRSDSMLHRADLCSLSPFVGGVPSGGCRSATGTGEEDIERICEPSSWL